MSLFQLVHSQVVPLTTEIAREFRDMTPSPTERELNATRLKHLRRKADEGLLVSFHWAKAKMNGHWLRVNGQHSATMLCEMNGDFPSHLQVHIDEYTVEGNDGLTQLFQQFDDRKSGRSASDVAGAFQNTEDDLKHITRSVAKLGVEAVTWYRRYIEGVQTPLGDEQYRLFHETDLHKYLLWLHELFSVKTPELRRVPVVAAIHATYERNNAEARLFWQQVARGGKEFDDNAASTVLDDWLKTQYAEGADLKPGDYYRGCIYAWNAYREDKPLKDIRHDARKAAQTVSD